MLYMGLSTTGEKDHNICITKFICWNNVLNFK